MQNSWQNKKRKTSDLETTTYIKSLQSKVMSKPPWLLLKNKYQKIKISLFTPEFVKNVICSKQRMKSSKLKENVKEILLTSCSNPNNRIKIEFIRFKNF